MSDLLAFFIKLIPSVFFAGLFYFYSSKRDFINKHPDSIIFKLFEWIDNIIVTKIEKEESEPIRNQGFVTSLHKYAEYDSLCNISDAKIISFGLSRNIPKKELLLFSTIIPLFVVPFITLVPIVIYLLFASLNQDTREALLGLTAIFYAAYIFVFLSAVYGQRYGIFGKMVSLYKDDGVEITITDKMVYLSTHALGSRVIKMSGIKEFGVMEKNHLLGLYYSDQKDRITWVIQYPKIYCKKIFTFQELEILKEDLNKVLISYKTES